MNMRTPIVVASFLLAAGLALAADKPLDTRLVEGYDQLPATQQTQVMEVLTHASCYYGCADTIAACLQKTPPSAGAKRLAAFVVRRVLAGRKPAEVREDLKQREKSAFPVKQYPPSVEGLPVLGAAVAPVKVEIYADCQCPYCGVASPALARLAREMPGKVGMWFKQFPVKSHALGVSCATAMEAASAQGKFWEMHDALYAHKDELSEDIISRLAAGVGLDMTRFGSDRKTASVLDRVRAQKMEGIDRGMTGTPGIFINGKYYAGLKTYPELRDRILEELEILEGVK